MDEREAFVQALREALSHLYDPATLRRSPLIQELGLSERDQPLRRLHRCIARSINDLKPRANAPEASAGQRLYHILNDRFLEQFTQRQVAMDLTLSIRQLRRLEKQAIDVLADSLWKQRVASPATLTGKDSAQPDMAPPTRSTMTQQAPTPDQELARLRTTQAEPIAVGELLDGIVGTLQPYLESAAVRVHFEIPSTLPTVMVRRITLRQALMNLIGAAARVAQQGQLDLITASNTNQTTTLEIVGLSDAATAVAAPMDDKAQRLTESLVQIAGGTLVFVKAASPASFHVRLTMPTHREVRVLGIDDNDDILQMMKRYLAMTPYHFSGCAEPSQALVLAEALRPDIILLDIMLPGIDGWELVGRFRENPRTHDTPILICSILPQEELASMLGAAGFVRKPVSRMTLLAALDRHCAGPASTDASSSQSPPADDATTALPHG